MKTSLQNPEFIHILHALQERLCHLEGTITLSPDQLSLLRHASRLSAAFESFKRPLPLQARPGHTLTPRELQVAHWIAHGRNNPAIAKILNMKPRTVDTHRTHLLQKFNVETRMEIAWCYLERTQGLRPPPCCPPSA